MTWLLALTLLAADGGTPSFAERAREVKPGTVRERVRELLGEPRRRSTDAKWAYQDPPNRPDGPYHWYLFTFAKDKVVKVDEGGVACVYRELSQ